MRFHVNAGNLVKWERMIPVETNFDLGLVSAEALLIAKMSKIENEMGNQLSFDLFDV